MVFTSQLLWRVGRVSNRLKLCCGQISSEITGENDERTEKETDEMCFVGLAIRTR